MEVIQFFFDEMRRFHLNFLVKEAKSHIVIGLFLFGLHFGGSSFGGSSSRSSSTSSGGGTSTSGGHGGQFSGSFGQEFFDALAFQLFDDNFGFFIVAINSNGIQKIFEVFLVNFASTKCGQKSCSNVTHDLTLLSLLKTRNVEIALDAKINFIRRSEFHNVPM